MGGAARELAKYRGIEEIHVVEIDRRVVEVAKEFLPQTACGFSDPVSQFIFKMESSLSAIRRTFMT